LAAAEVDIPVDAKCVFSPRTVLDWPTFRAVVDSEIAPLFDLFLGLIAWMPVYSLHMEQIYDHLNWLQTTVHDTSVRDDLRHAIVKIKC
jgi:hypothetical protein